MAPQTCQAVLALSAQSIGHQHTPLSAQSSTTTSTIDAEGAMLVVPSRAGASLTVPGVPVCFQCAVNDGLGHADYVPVHPRDLVTDRFSCAHAFLLFARHKFAMSQSWSSPEEKNYQSTNTARLTCRNNSRKPHVCSWEMRADSQGRFWVVQPAGPQASMHPDFCYRNYVAPSKSQPSRPKKGQTTPSCGKKRTAQRRPTKLAGAKLLLELQRFGANENDWHPYRRRRRQASLDSLVTSTSSAVSQIKTQLGQMAVGELRSR